MERDASTTNRLAVQVWAQQDQGRLRERQEDSCFAQAIGSQPVALLIVADGMGGHQGGNIASKAAVTAASAALAPLLQQLEPSPTLRLPEPEAQEGDVGAAASEAAAIQPAPPVVDPKRTVVLSPPTIDLRAKTVQLGDDGEGAADEGQVEAALVQAVERTQAAVRTAAQQINALDDAGTTLTLVVVAGLTLYCAQVGDSRAYLWRHSQLRQLTSDHSGAAALVAAGVITPEEARTHPVAHQLYRYLGGTAQAARPDISRHTLLPGDLLLLCSDGLWDMLPDAEIAAILLTGGDLQALATKLIDAANAAGGEDNITVVLGVLAEERQE